MRLEKVTLTNFRSYKGVHIFGPRPGTTFLLGSNSDDGYSSNGGGKTSLLSSVAWALYGELATGASKDAVIHYGEPEVTVEVQFRGLTVRRGKKRAKPEQLEFFVDEWGEWVKEDLNETQDKLDRYLGVGRELFYNAFWLDNASKTVQFLFKRPADRLQALQELLGEGFFSKAKKECSTKRGGVEKEISLQENDLSWRVKEEASMVNRVFDLEQQLEKEKDRVAKADEERSNALCGLESQVESTKRSIESLTSFRDMEEDKIRVDPEDLIKTCAVLEAQITQAETAYHKQYSGNAGDRCPTCMRVMDHDDKEKLKKEKKELYAEINRLRIALDEAMKKKNQVQKEKLKVDKLSSEIIQLKSSLVVQTKILEQSREAARTVDTSVLSKIEDMITKERIYLTFAREEIENTKKSIESLKEVLPKLKFWEEGFGSKGVQNLLLDDVRGLLDQFTRNYLSHFSGEVLKVVYPKSDKGFEINMSYRDKEIPVSNLSRGEVGRANMAVLLALRKMLLYMHRSRIDFIVLDDAISDLDESGTQSIVDLSEVLAKEVGNVFLTLPQHVPGIRPDKVVRVTKKDGVSCLT